MPSPPDNGPPAPGRDDSDRLPETDAPVDESEMTATDQPEETIEPPTRPTQKGLHRPPAAGSPDSTTRQPTASPAEKAGVDGSASVSGAVDSKWWYCVAAVPIYAVIGLIAGIIGVVLFLLGIAVDVGGAEGIATGVVVVLVVLGVGIYGLAGLALSLLFPIGVYLDAKTITEADVSWDPDPVLYLLVAAGSVLLTAFTLSFVVAVYYLYRRNQAVGVP